jgi:hypothetical protein
VKRFGSEILVINGTSMVFQVIHAIFDTSFQMGEAEEKRRIDLPKGLFGASTEKPVFEVRGEEREEEGARFYSCPAQI